jgi:NDP-sugar pyrophosphorylase family protein
MTTRAVHAFEINENGGWIVPDGTEIWPDTIIPDYSTLGLMCKLGDGCTLGGDCTLGDGCELGYGCKLGDRCTLGDGCELGQECKLGDGCTWLGVKVERFMTAANIPGSGQQVTVVLGSCGAVKVEDCFYFGTADEFCALVESEGGLIYARVVRAIAEAIKEGE